MTHSETPTQELIMKGHGTRSEGDGATEENAKLEGWQEKQRVSNTCRSDIKPALQSCKTAENLGEGNGLITRTGPPGTKKEGSDTGDTDGNGSETG